MGYGLKGTMLDEFC